MATFDGQVAPRLLRFPEVRARVGLCRSTIYSKIAAAEFPSPIPLGTRAVGWDSRAIDAWIVARIVAAAQAVENERREAVAA